MVSNKCPTRGPTLSRKIHKFKRRGEGSVGIHRPSWLSPRPYYNSTPSIIVLIYLKTTVDQGEAPRLYKKFEEKKMKGGPSGCFSCERIMITSQEDVLSGLLGKIKIFPWSEIDDLDHKKQHLVDLKTFDTIFFCCNYAIQLQ